MEKIVKNEYQGEKMQINKTDNVIYLKEVESNIIEQAFIILKDNIKVDFKNFNNNNKCGSDINIIKDAENLINSEIEKNNIKFERFKNDMLNRKIKILKATNIISIIILIVIILIK